MKPTSSQLERMIVEIGLNIPIERSLLPMDDPDMIEARTRLAAQMADMERRGIMVDIPAEIPDVIIVPEGWAQQQK